MAPASVLLALCATLLLALSRAADQPNIVFILADDLNADYDQDRHRIMPTLKKYFVDGGLQFVNHVVAYPVCGPSRSSFLAGRYPHNVGYTQNGGANSVANWRRQENNTVGQWLTDAGYHTAFLGKYVNAMECNTPSGFNHWGGLTCADGGRLGGTYNYYNASQWQVEYDVTGRHARAPPTVRIWNGVHQSTFIANQTLNQARVAISNNKPFFIHATPLMVHYGTCYGPQPESKYAPTDPYFEHSQYNPNLNPQGKPIGDTDVTISPCPTVNHAHAFDGVQNPHVPSWNNSGTGLIPVWMRGYIHDDYNGCCDDWRAARQDIGFRNRSAALLDLDQLFNTIFTGLESLGVLNNTYVIFSSDNGYHLGQHKMLFGKTEPFDHDISVPFYVRGPGVPAGEIRQHPTNHIDITATIVDLANAAATAPKDLEGKSFKQVITANPPSIADWRPWSFSEFKVNNNTWAALRFINATSGNATHKLVFWCTGEHQVFRYDDDPWEIQNIQASAFGQNVISNWFPTLLGLTRCKGAECQNPTPVSPVPPNPYPCFTDGGGLLDVPEVAYDP